MHKAINKRMAKPTAMPAIAPFGNGDLLDESVAGGVASDVAEPDTVIAGDKSVWKMNCICLAQIPSVQTLPDRVVVVVAGLSPGVHNTSTSVVMVGSGWRTQVAPFFLFEVGMCPLERQINQCDLCECSHDAKA